MGDERRPVPALPGLDFNGDGKITISDAGDWFFQLVLLPGDAALGLLMRFAPELAAFLELGPEDLGSTLSMVVSGLFWFLALCLLAMIWNGFRNFDRWLTNWIAGHLREGLRLTRVARRRLFGWYLQRRQRNAAAEQAVTVGEVDLQVFDRAVLRCYGSVKEMRVLAVDDVARSLRTSLRQVQAALGRLGENHLIEPVGDTGSVRDGYQITRAGQLYLLGR